MSAFDCREVCNVDCEKDVNSVVNSLISSDMVLANKEIISIVLGVSLYLILGYFKKDITKTTRIVSSVALLVIVYYILSSKVSEIMENAEDVKTMCNGFKEQCNCV